MRAVSRDRSEEHGNSRGKERPSARPAPAQTSVPTSAEIQTLPEGAQPGRANCQEPTGSAGEPPSGGRSPCGRVSLAALRPEPPGKVSGRGGSGSPALGSCSKGLPGTPGALHEASALSCHGQRPSAKPAACFLPGVWGGADHLTTEHQVSAARVALHELPPDPPA